MIVGTFWHLRMPLFVSLWCEFKFRLIEYLFITKPFCTIHTIIPLSNEILALCEKIYRDISFPCCFWYALCFRILPAECIHIKSYFYWIRWLYNLMSAGYSSEIYCTPKFCITASMYTIKILPLIIHFST